MLVINNPILKSIHCCGNHLSQRQMISQGVKLLVGLSSSGDYKRTQQGALATLLPYIYVYTIVCATTMFYYVSCPKGLMSISCLLHSDCARLCILL